MEVRAVARYVRISPRKIRILAGAVKNKPVEEALEMLRFMPQKGAAIIAKVLRSAAANANEQSQLDVDDLIVSNVLSDCGPILKRFKARARGRGTRILKRSSHVTVILTEA